LDLIRNRGNKSRKKKISSKLLARYGKHQSPDYSLVEGGEKRVETTSRYKKKEGGRGEEERTTFPSSYVRKR